MNVNMRAPSLAVSALFALGALLGYWYLGASETSALLTGAISAATALWKFLQVYKEPASVQATDRNTSAGKFSRLLFG